MRASVRLQTRDCPDNVCLWMSSTHRVPSRAAASNQQSRQSICSTTWVRSWPALEIGAFADNVEAKILTAEPDKHAWPPTRLHSWDRTSRRWLLRQLPQKHKKNALAGSSLAPWLAGATDTNSRLDSTSLGSDPGYDQGRTQDMASKTLAAVRWALPNLPRPMSRSFPSAIARLEPGSSRPPAPRVLVLLVARWLAEHHLKLLGLYFCLHVETEMRPSEGLALRGFQLLPPIKGTSGAAGKCSSERAGQGSLPNRRVRDQRLGGPGTPTVPVSRSALLKDTRGERQLPFPFSYTRATKEMENALKQLRCQQLQITPYALRHGGASDDCAVNARGLEEVQKRRGWKSFHSVRRYEKHARLSLVVTKIPPELLWQGPALECDLERLWKRL